MIAECLGGESGVERTKAGATIFLVHKDAVQTEFTEPVPEILIETVARFGEPPQRLDRQSRRQERTQGIVEQSLFFTQSETHGQAPTAAFGSRGSPSPRSPMMFF